MLCDKELEEVFGLVCERGEVLNWEDEESELGGAVVFAGVVFAPFPVIRALEVSNVSSRNKILFSNRNKFYQMQNSSSIHLHLMFFSKSYSV